MGQEQGSTVTLVVETQPPLPSFLDDKIDLKKLAQSISKATSKAVEVLLKLVDSKDEKVALAAASKLLDMQVAVAKEISSDQMQRLIAEIKLVRGPTKTLVPASDAPKRPLVDFGTIRQVE